MKIHILRSNRFILLMLLIGSIIPGCQSDSLVDESQPDKETLPLSPAHLCELYEVYSALTDAQNGPPEGPLCSGKNAQSHLDLTAYEKSVLCRPGSDGYKWGQTLISDAQEGRITVDWKAARQCIRQSLALRQTNPANALLTDPLWKTLKEEGACGTFYKGNSKDGETCTRDWDCQRGSWCSSETPFQPNTRVCIPERIAGEACSEHLPCSADFVCDGEVCVEPQQDSIEPAPTLGSGCTPEEDDRCSLIGKCIGCRALSQGAPTTCEFLGGEEAYCESKRDCVSDLGCTNNKCTAVELGEACMTTPDSPSQSMCANDAFCIDTCWRHDGNEVECSGDPNCVFDSASGYCDSTTFSGICIKNPTVGDPCLFDVYCDGKTSFCEPSTKRCIAHHGVGESCIANPENPQGSCSMALACIDEVCVDYCLYNEDCAEGHYCDFSSETEPPSCKPKELDACQQNAECDEGQFCDRCELQMYNQSECNMDMDCAWVVEVADCRNECSAHMDEDSCGLYPQCGWNAIQETCDSVCSSLEPSGCEEFDGCGLQTKSRCENAQECWDFEDEESCNSAGCWFDPENSFCADQCSQYSESDSCNANPNCQYDDEWLYCTSACPGLSEDSTGCNALDACTWIEKEYCTDEVDCIDFTSSDTACNAQESCRWHTSGFCSAATAQTTFECADQVAIGDFCQSDSMCQEEGVCAYDENQEPRCQFAAPELDPSCNYNSIEFLKGAFLLGLVVTIRQRRKRRV